MSFHGLFRTKPLEQLLADTQQPEKQLKRALGPVHLTALGIGAIIGAGAGTGAQAASRGAQVQVPAESMLSFRLTKPLTVVPSSTLQGARRLDPDSSQDPLSLDDRLVLKRRPGSPPADADAPAGSPSSDSGSTKEPITPPN